MIPKTYKHLKTGRLYVVFCHIVEDCTNIRAGTKCVLYTPIDGDRMFVREADEFNQKFVPYSPTE